MTHILNIPHILRYGITHAHSANANPDYVPIGDGTIIAKRANDVKKTVGGEVFVIGDYTPFYFHARMPMLYNIQHGYHVPKRHPRDIVYMVVSISSIISDDERKILFSDGHPVSPLTRFYGKRDLARMDALLDKDAIRSTNWGDDPQVKARKQAEFLIFGDIPPEQIILIGCYDEQAKSRLLDMGVQCRIDIVPKAYY